MSGKKRILMLLIGFFVFFYACWAVGMSIYTENMPVVKVKDAAKMALTFEGTIISHYHRVEEQQEYPSPFDAKIEEVFLKDGEDVGMGRVVIRFSTEDIQTQLAELERQFDTGLLDGADEETKEALNEQYRLLKQVADSGELTAQTSWRKIQSLVAPGDRVTVGTPLFSGIAATDKAYLAWDMSANDAIYFERGTPIPGIQLSVREDNKTVSKKFDLAVTSKVYEPKTNRYIYQIELPESVDFFIVDGSAVAMPAVSQGKHEHGGVIPTSAVIFDETDVTFFVLKERERIWGTEFYAEECRAAAEEVAGGQVALTYFPNGGQVIYETSKPLANGMAVRVEK